MSSLTEVVVETKDNRLLYFVMDYITEHSDDIVLSDDWHAFMEGGPTLGV